MLVRPVLISDSAEIRIKAHAWQAGFYPQQFPHVIYFHNKTINL